LSAAGFVNGIFTFTIGDATRNDTNSWKNPYSIYMQLSYDNNYGSSTPPDKHTVKTGGQIPVEIIAEVDRKLMMASPIAARFSFLPTP
jgi:hypothetical protein